MQDLSEGKQEMLTEHEQLCFEGLQEIKDEHDQRATG